MQTHIKETLVTLGTFIVLSLTVSAGMVFKLVGVPSIRILNYPFHYIWFVVGAWVSLFVGFGIYHRYVGRLKVEKEALRNDTPEMSEPIDSTGTSAKVTEHTEES